MASIDAQQNVNSVILGRGEELPVDLELISVGDNGASSIDQGSKPSVDDRAYEYST